MNSAEYSNHVVVYMARNEWSSHEQGRIMERIAAETLFDHPQRERTMVEVYEHAGWFLRYALDDQNRLQIVGSANDCSRCNDEQLKVLQRLHSAIQWTYSEIRRN